MSTVGSSLYVETGEIPYGAATHGVRACEPATHYAAYPEETAVLLRNPAWFPAANVDGTVLIYLFPGRV